MPMTRAWKSVQLPRLASHAKGHLPDPSPCRSCRTSSSPRPSGRWLWLSQGQRPGPESPPGRATNGTIQRDQRLGLEILGSGFVAQNFVVPDVLPTSRLDDERYGHSNRGMIDPDMNALITEPGFPSDGDSIRGVDRDPMDGLVPIGLRQRNPEVEDLRSDRNFLDGRPIGQLKVRARICPSEPRRASDPRRSRAKASQQAWRFKVWSLRSASSVRAGSKCRTCTSSLATGPITISNPTVSHVMMKLGRRSA